MTQTEQIILLVWVLGIVFNLFMVKKIFPDELYNSKGGDFFDIFLIFFMLPIILLQYMLKAIFIIGSWMSWVAVVIMIIIEKVEEWHNTNIKKRKE